MMSVKEHITSLNPILLRESVKSCRKLETWIFIVPVPDAMQALGGSAHMGWGRLSENIEINIICRMIAAIFRSGTLLYQKVARFSGVDDRFFRQIILPKFNIGANSIANHDLGVHVPHAWDTGFVMSLGRAALLATSALRIQGVDDYPGQALFCIDSVAEAIDFNM